VRNILLGIPVVGPFLYAATSPIGLAIVGVVAFFVWLGVHDAAIRRDALADCRADELRRTIAELERQNEVFRNALRKSEIEAAEDDARLEKLSGQVDKIQSDAAPRKRECIIDPADIQRLRNIR
jgi:hypothetical protein